MMYYIDSIEQIIKDGQLTEYGGREKVGDENSALSKYYKKLSNVSADLGKNHTYMDIKITISTGGVIKKDSIGTYQTTLSVNTSEGPIEVATEEETGGFN